MPFRIAVIPGDGIGPEVNAQGLRVLEAVTAATGTQLDRVMYDLGAERYLRTGEILPDAVFAELQSADAIYLGAVGDPRVQDPQYAACLLLRLRFELDLWVNLRPSRLLAPGLTPLRDVASIDLVVVRENTEGAYVGIGGQFKRGTADEIAIQEDVNTRKGVERIQRYAFELARQRRQAAHRGRGHDVASPGGRGGRQPDRGRRDGRSAGTPDDEGSGWRPDHDRGGRSRAAAT